MIRVSYSLAVFLALIFGCVGLSLAQDNPVAEKTGSTASTSLNSKAPDAVAAPSSSPERNKPKSISKADRENAKRSYKAGVNYARGGLVRQAVESFEQAIGHDPQFADAYSALGKAYFDLGRLDDALGVLEKALKLNPQAADSKTLLGQVQAKLKEKSVLSAKTNDLISIEASNPSTKPEAISGAKPAADADPTAVYYVGVSDVLDIRLPGGSTGESTLYVVAGNGHLDHPILGRPIKVSGLTTDQIAALFSAELKRLSIKDQPPPEISVRDFNSHTILVSGLIKEPGAKILRREAIPLYVVLADAQPLADAGFVDIMSQSAVKHRAIDLSHPEQTAVLVRPGDVVTVRAAKKEFFYASGNVKSPGEHPFRAGLTLTQAIMSAGGVTLKGEKVQLTRGKGNGLLTLQEFKLKEINSGKVPDPLIEPGDRITVLP